MKKLLSIIIVLTMVIGLLCACGDSEKDTSESAVSAEASAEQSDVSEASAEDEALVPHLGKTDKYKNKTIRILATYGDFTYGTSQFCAEEINSDPVNNAVYERNEQLFQEYGFNIEVEFTTNSYADFVTQVRKDVEGGDVDYDCISTGLQTMFSIAAEGYLLDYYSIPGEQNHIKFDGDWWDQPAQEDLSIKNKLFAMTGDILIEDDEFTQCIFYNKDIIAAHTELENPSKLALEGKWTLDEMQIMCKAVAMPSESTGEMEVATGETVWGFVGAAFDIFKLVLGCACPQVEKNSEDVPVLAMGNERNLDAYLKASEIMTDPSITAYIEKYYRWDDPDASNIAAHFYNGNALFYSNLVGTVNSDKLRNADISYGILPMPKYDETQVDYATTVDPYKCMVISIMDGTTDLDFVTFALEAMAYTGKTFLTPEYYERTLKNKRILDDEDSAEILDIIFSNRQFDISVCYNWDDCIQYYNSTLWTYTAGVVSLLEARTNAFNAALNETLEDFGD